MIFLSIYGAFLGAERAEEFFNRLPLAVYWVALMIVLIIALASFRRLVYVGYLHFHYMFGKKHPHINSLWAIAGMVVIVITLLWVNLPRLSPGLHSYAI